MYCMKISIGVITFAFWREYGFVNDIRMSFDGNDVFSYFPKDQPLKICVRNVTKHASVFLY